MILYKLIIYIRYYYIFLFFKKQTLFLTISKLQITYQTFLKFMKLGLY